MGKAKTDVGEKREAQRQLQDFDGVWQIDRVIRDHRADSDGTFTGTATFAPGEGGLICTEIGTLQMQGQVAMTAERRYIWRAGGAGQIAVFFDDGRAFHQFALAGDSAEATHHCDPDIYQVRYDFSRWPIWRIVWQVEGPRKSYQLTSEYRR